MIKRRFYRQEHGDGDETASDSSDSSDSDSPPLEEEGNRSGDGSESEQDGDDEKGRSLSPLPGSGYESEDSSEIELPCDSSGALINEGGSQPREDSDVCAEGTEQPSKTSAKVSTPKPVPELDSCILKYKSAFKCRLCPRIICLNEKTVREHLNSKRHARSKKLLGEGRLKLTLNSFGEIEEEQETHAERHARIIALAKETDAQNKASEGHNQQKKKRKKKFCGPSDGGGIESSKRPKRKQRKAKE